MKNSINYAAKLDAAETHSKALKLVKAVRFYRRLVLAHEPYPLPKPAEAIQNAQLEADSIYQSIPDRAKPEEER